MGSINLSNEALIISMWKLLSQFIDQLPSNIARNLRTNDENRRNCLKSIFMDAVIISEYFVGSLCPEHFEDDFCKPFICHYFKLVKSFNELLYEQGWSANNLSLHYKCFLHLITSWLFNHGQVIEQIVDSDSDMFLELISTCDIFNPAIPFSIDESEEQFILRAEPLKDLEVMKRDISLQKFNFLSGNVIDGEVLKKLAIPSFYFGNPNEIYETFHPKFSKIEWPSNALIHNEYGAGKVKLFKSDVKPMKQSETNLIAASYSFGQWNSSSITKNLTYLLINDCCDRANIGIGNLYGYLLIKHNEKIGLRVMPVAESCGSYVLYQVDFGKFIVCKNVTLYVLPKEIQKITYGCHFVQLSGFSPEPDFKLISDILDVIFKLSIKGIVTCDILNKAHVAFVLQSLSVCASYDLSFRGSKIIHCLSQSEEFPRVFPYSIDTKIIDLGRHFNESKFMRVWLSILNNVAYNSLEKRKAFIKRNIFYVLLKLSHNFPSLEDIIWQCLKSLTIQTKSHIRKETLDVSNVNILSLLGYKTRNIQCSIIDNANHAKRSHIVADGCDVVAFPSFNSKTKPVICSLICSFRNGNQKGLILFGAVQNGEKFVVEGIKMDPKEREEFLDEMSVILRYIYPPLSYDSVVINFESITDEDQNLYLVRVVVSNSEVVHYATVKNNKPKVFVRKDGNNVNLSHQEVRELVIKKYLSQQ